MKLVAPARLRKRLRERDKRLDGLAITLAATVAVWRARLVRHRLAIAVLGGGIAGVTVATRWRSLVHVGAALVAAAVRAAALSTVARARVNRAVAAHLSRASRTM